MTRHETFREAAFWLAVAGLSTGLCLVAFRGLLPNFATQLIGEHNDAVYGLNTLYWHWQMLSEMRLTSVLDAPIMAPLPHGHAYGDNLFALALLGFPVARVAGEFFAYNTLVVATFVLCAIFGAGFGRALTGSRLAGMVVGLCFAFLPIRLAALHEINNLATMWLALAAWALVRWYENAEWRWVAVGLLAVYGQLLSSIQLLIHFTVLAALWFAWLWVRSRFSIRPRVVAQLAAFFTVAVLLFAPWAAVYAQVRTFLPGSRSTDEMHMYTPPVSHWLTRLWLGDVLVLLFAVALLLLLAGIIPRVRESAWWRVPGHVHLGPLVAATVLGFVMAQGPMTIWDGEFVSLPYYWLSQVFPLLKTIRAPQRVQRVMALFASGAGGVAVTWLMLLTRRCALAAARERPRLRHFKRWAPALPAVLLIGVVALQVPLAGTRTRAISVPGVTGALRKLPETALVFPLPFFLNWPRRPPLDYIAVQTRVRMVGGYGGAIPGLFRRMKRHVGLFPDDSALQVIEAIGATHLLINTRAFSDEQNAGVYDLQTRGILKPVFIGSTWQLWELPPGSVRVFAPLEQPASAFAVRGPSAVAPGQRLTLALEPLLDRTHVDPVHRRKITAETVDDGARVVGVQRAHLYSPYVVEPGGFPYQLSLDVPTTPGRYIVRVPWPSGRDRSLTYHLEVRGNLETSANHPTRRSVVSQVGVPRPAFRHQSIYVDLAIRNEDQHVWLSRSDEELPAQRGTMALHATLRGPRTLHRFYLPSDAFRLLPHDLAPGDEAVTRQYLVAPQQPGEYELIVSFAPHHVKDGRAERHTLEPVRVH